jgi:exopolyphosphatase/guanosine-5'-triphosphate,3'-diphosphate pyrophosphatase
VSQADHAVAALDIGSNTVRMLVACAEAGELRPLLDRSAFARLGSGVDRTGVLDPERQERALTAVLKFTEEARRLGVEGIRTVATSAVRDARNGPDFAERLAREAGIEVEIVSGEEEARLTFLGATLGVPLDDELLVFDIGGGSGEVITAQGGEIAWARELPVGSGRLTERFVKHDPPQTAELEAVGQYVWGLLKKLPATRPKKVVGTGGTAKHVTVLLGLKGLPIDVTPVQLEEVLEILTTSPHKEVAERFGIEPERAPVLPAGVQTIRTICQFYGFEALTITANGIRQGMIIDQLMREGRWPRSGG